MCGEKYLNMMNEQREKGSPPRVRGKVIKIDGYQIALGITPACAGKSGLEIKIWMTQWDHPRVCGEKTKKIP